MFAPGIAGTAVIANLSRVMFVIGRLKVAAAALAGSWLITIVADVVLVELVPARLVVAALALGTTIGQTVVAIPLVSVTRRICGPAAVRGAGHATVAGLAACAAGAAVGVAVAWQCPCITSWTPSPWQCPRSAARSWPSAWSRTSSTTAT